MSDDERRKLVSTEQSLGGEPDAKMPTAISGLETFTLAESDEPEEKEAALPDADSLFTFESSDDDKDDDSDDPRD